MQETKLISIIIPMYNAIEFVPKVTQSILSQQFHGFEVVLIDDGSTDNSLELCQYFLKDIDVIAIRQENAGLSGARNAGIWEASGEYILFLDADDFLLPGALINISAALENNRPDVLFGRFRRWSPSEGLYRHKPYEYNPPINPAERTEYILSALPELSWNAWRYICSRRFLLEQELFFKRGILCEDVPWTLELLETADTINFLDEPFYAYYHRRPLSIMNSLNPKRLIDLNASVRILLERFSDRPAICRQLIWQSLLYVNEYCRFGRSDRILLLESYRAVFPLYVFSDVRLHRVVKRCKNPMLVYGLSACLFLLKHVRRVVMRIRGADRQWENEVVAEEVRLPKMTTDTFYT